MIKVPRYFRKETVYLGEPSGILKRIVWHFHRKRRKFASMKLTRVYDRILWKSKSNLKLTILNKVQVHIYQRIGGAANFILLPLVRHKDIADQNIEIYKAGVSTVEPPTRPGERLRIVNQIQPAIEAHIFSKVITAENSAAVCRDNKIAVPDLYLSSRSAMVSDGGFLVSHSDDLVGLVSNLEAKRQPDAIMLFGLGSANWYHWLIETLPIAYFTERLNDGLSDLPLAIPHRISSLPTFRESLEIFRNGREVIEIPPGPHSFDKLVLVDSVVREPFNLRVGLWPEVRDYAFNLEALQQYRSALISRLGIRESQQNRKVFLARKHGRRTYNQSQLLEIAAGHGFEAVYLEELTFFQQAQLLSESSHVIGPSGAAFSNTIFCQKGTRLMSWLPKQYRNFCSYTNLAVCTGSSLRFLDLDFEHPVKSSIEVFGASYSVNSADFEAGLRLALEGRNY